MRAYFDLASIPGRPAHHDDRYRVLVVDDDGTTLEFLQTLLVRNGWNVRTVSETAGIRSALDAHAPDVVLLDVMLPGGNGFDICRALKADPATRLTPIVLVTGLSDPQSRITGREAGADDFLSKPVDIQELLARVRTLARLKRYTDDLDSASAIIMTLTEMIELRDGYTEGHCYRMANYATALGRRLRLSTDQLQVLHRGGFLHDIGMLAIPDKVLSKSGPLDPVEYELVKSHTVVGDRLCARLRSLQNIRPIVRHHHERHDGSGYPDGLSGEAIPLEAAIIGIVDMFDAVTTQRPYQDAHSFQEALGALRWQVEMGWRRRDLVEEFAGLVESGQLETFAR